MSLSGSLRTLKLDEILLTLSRSQANGILRLVNAEDGRDLVVIDGSVAQMCDHDPAAETRMLQRLQASGLVPASLNPDDLGESSGGYSIITALVEKFGAKEAHIWSALREQTMAELCNLFLWDEASFMFLEADGEEDSELTHQLRLARERPLRIAIEAVVLEAARRLDEWQLISSHSLSSEQVPCLVEGREDAAQELLGSAYPNGMILPLINGRRNVQDLTRETIATSFDVHIALATLRQHELLRICPVTELIERAPDSRRAW